MSVNPAHQPELESLLAISSGLNSTGGNDRLKNIMHQLLSDLCKTIKQFDVTDEEFWIAVNYLNELGGRQEAALLAAGTAGYASIGTLFAAMLARTRTRDVLLPLLLYPMSVPVIIAGVRGTSAALADPYAPGIVSFWLSLLICFDAVFATLALWTFGALMTEAAPRVAKEA